MIAVPTMPRPGAYLRACAFLAWLTLPARLYTSWQWYRRCHGGIWALGPDGTSWRPVAACPAPMWTAILGAGPVPPGVCYESEALGSECHCEVWS